VPPVRPCGAGRKNRCAISAPLLQALCILASDKAMTEYEILYLLSETFDRVWELIQYWSSVSFGYLILAYVAAPRLNLILIVVLSILYAAFSVQMFELLLTHNGFNLAYIESLNELSKTV
jgi:hypothetical protein